MSAAVVLMLMACLALFVGIQVWKTNDQGDGQAPATTFDASSRLGAPSTAPTLADQGDVRRSEDLANAAPFRCHIEPSARDAAAPSYLYRPARNGMEVPRDLSMTFQDDDGNLLAALPNGAEPVVLMLQGGRDAWDVTLEQDSDGVVWCGTTQPRSPRAILSGTVVDRDGVLRQNALVYGCDSAAVSDRAGRFELQIVSDGSCTVAVWCWASDHWRMGSVLRVEGDATGSLVVPEGDFGVDPEVVAGFERRIDRLEGHRQWVLDDVDPDDSDAVEAIRPYLETLEEDIAGTRDIIDGLYGPCSPALAD